MASKRGNEFLLKEYTDLKRLITSHKKATETSSGRTFGTETQSLLKEYTDLKRLIDSHKKTVTPVRPIMSLATNNESQNLLKEYADLKRLIDTHKQSSGSHRLPFSTTNFASQTKLNHFSRKNTSLVRKNSISDSSLYALNRTKSQVAKSRLSYNYNSGKTPTSSSSTKYLNNAMPSKNVLTNASANRYRLSNGSQLQLPNPNVAKTSTLPPKNALKTGICLQNTKTASRKQETLILSSKPPQNVIPLRKTQSKYKLIKPSSGQNNSKSTNLKSLIQSPSPYRKLQSKYKFERNAKQTPSKRSPLTTKSRKSGNRSKYSWALNGSPSQKSFGGHLLKSRFSLSKVARKRSPGVSPRLVRRVNKYSVKYVQQKQRSLSGKTTRKGSDLVLIGGMLYKSSKTKLSRAPGMKTSPLKTSGSSKAKQRIVTVRGVRFSMDLNRKVLQRLPTSDQQSSVVARPELKKSVDTMSGNQRKLTRIDIGGETYIQTRPGVLVRSSANQLRNLANRVVNRSLFRLRASKEKKQQYCLFYNKFGKCNNKEKGTCPYIHDPDKIAVCKRFLRGECTVERCPFAHTKCRAKMPVCTFFLHGRCNNDSCNYSHVNVNPKADICLDFAKGYCPLGEECKKWHASICPQYELTGNCDKADKCPLKHRPRAAKPPKRRIEELVATSLADSVACVANTAEPLTKTRRLPSFISLSNESEDRSSDEVQKVSDVPLQIKPAFMTQN